MLDISTTRDYAAERPCIVWSYRRLSGATLNKGEHFHQHSKIRAKAQNSSHFYPKCESHYASMKVLLG